jgi:hypothetical protein
MVRLVVLVERVVTAAPVVLAVLVTVVLVKLAVRAVPEAWVVQ